jgi:hypothetical protein
MRYIDEYGMRNVMSSALAGLDANTHLHVSFDIDCLDPSIAPGVGTAVMGGPTYREAQLCMEMIADTGLLGSLDVVELNPALDVRNQSATLAVDLIESLFGKSTLVVTDPVLPAAKHKRRVLRRFVYGFQRLHSLNTFWFDEFRLSEFSFDVTSFYRALIFPLPDPFARNNCILCKNRHQAFSEHAQPLFSRTSAKMAVFLCRNRISGRFALFSLVPAICNQPVKKPPRRAVSFSCDADGSRLRSFSISRITRLLSPCLR